MIKVITEEIEMKKGKNGSAVEITVEREQGGRIEVDHFVEHLNYSTERGKRRALSGVIRLFSSKTPDATRVEAKLIGPEFSGF